MKWITLAFEVNTLKKSRGEIFLASSLPLLLRHSPCPIWSNLELEKRGETVWRWGDANNVAPHLMCLKCLWPVRPALWSATNLMVSEVQGDVEQTDRRKKTLAHGSTLESQEARTTEEKVYLVSCYVLEILSTTLNYVSSFQVCQCCHAGSCGCLTSYSTVYILSGGNIHWCGIR